MLGSMHVGGSAGGLALKAESLDPRTWMQQQGFPPMEPPGWVSSLPFIRSSASRSNSLFCSLSQSEWQCSTSSQNLDAFSHFGINFISLVIENFQFSKNLSVFNPPRQLNRWPCQWGWDTIASWRELITLFRRRELARNSVTIVYKDNQGCQNKYGLPNEIF